MAVAEGEDFVCARFSSEPPDCLHRFPITVRQSASMTSEPMKYFLARKVPDCIPDDVVRERAKSSFRLGNIASSEGLFARLLYDEPAPVVGQELF